MLIDLDKLYIDLNVQGSFSVYQPMDNINTQMHSAVRGQIQAGTVL